MITSNISPLNSPQPLPPPSLFPPSSYCYKAA